VDFQLIALWQQIHHAQQRFDFR